MIRKTVLGRLPFLIFVDAMNPMIVVRPAAAAMTFAIVRISIHTDVTVVAIVVFVVLAVAAAGLAAAVMLSIFFIASDYSASAIDWCDRFGTRHQRPAQLANLQADSRTSFQKLDRSLSSQ